MHVIQPKPEDERRAYGVFITSLTATLILLLSGIFLGMAIRNSGLIRETVLERSRSLFQEIVLTRRWAAGYGGVYVRKLPGVESNPWLDHPDIEAADGSVLTLRNPALITREISEIAGADADFRFHITSLKPLNPGNAPDGFERGALAMFEAGETEYWATEVNGDSKEFRYMGALKTEASCLACHAAQGYSVGDIRGGISVSFPVDAVERELRRNTVGIVALALLVSAGVLTMVFMFVATLRRKLDAARTALEEAAITDGLTGMHNRRFGMMRFHQEIEKTLRDGSSLSCAIMDADDFKKINDELGHQAGDRALLAISAALKSGIRPYDTACRYGGEEFLLILPGTDGEAALNICERIRADIGSRGAAVLPPGMTLSVSCGITTWRRGEASPPEENGGDRATRLVDSLLIQSDAALYRAKARGKDRCESC